MENIFGATAGASDVATAVTRDGYAVVRDAIDANTLGAVAADLQPYLDRAHTGHEEFMGSLTKRFGALIAKSTAVQALIMHPTVLAVADHALLPSCAAYRVHFTGVMHLEPGEKQQVLHRDTSLYPFANPCPPLTVATMWAISDFTRQNGGTRICPGTRLQLGYLGSYIGTMVLSIKSAAADELARELAELTGESITDAVVASLRARLDLERRRCRERSLDDIVERFRQLMVLDEREADDILGYDEHGLPS